MEKRDLMGTMFSETDLAQQERLKCVFDAEALLNPGKVFPVSASLCRTRPCSCARRGRRAFLTCRGSNGPIGALCQYLRKGGGGLRLVPLFLMGP